jgi:aryl-alcohol dehydrogenase-like predicted oxidoreductase
MEYRRLGKSGIRISRFGVGTGAFPEAGAPRHGTRLLCEAACLGVTFWDTANNYDTYREIRLALRRLGPGRSTITISSKLEAQTFLGASRQLTHCLREIGRDWVDIMLLHYVQEPLVAWHGALEALAKAKRRGEVLAIGLSTHHPRSVRDAIKTGELDCVFVTLNMTGTWVEGRGGSPAMIEACQEAKRAGLGVVILKVLGNGQLVGRKAQALRWAVSRSFVDGIIVGVETIAQLREDLVYFTDGRSPRDYLASSLTAARAVS